MSEDDEYMNKCQGLTRSQQRTDVAYVCPSGDVFVSPDGEGRYWYEAAEHADPLAACFEDLGPLPVLQLTQAPEDF
jgi:hypothetical protein